MRAGTLDPMKDFLKRELRETINALPNFTTIQRRNPDRMLALRINRVARPEDDRID